MLKSLVKASGIIAGLALSSMAYAVGMGGINVSSALGQPLAVEIELVSVNKVYAGMSAHLASPDVFKGAGIDYPYSLPKIKFVIDKRADGTPYLKLTTKDPVNDPFVSLLVELDWASGRLLREYTFLLDPPDYKPEQPKAEAVQPIEPAVAEPQPEVVQPESQATAVPPQVETQPMRATAPMDKQALAAAKPASQTAARSLVSGSITVKRGDTLTKIAAQVQEPDVTLEQMLVALYRANASQFDGRNMNRLRAGKILRMPTDSEMANLSNTEAIKVIHAQAADWHAYRQKLAAASTAASEQAAQQEVSGKISTSVADQTPAAKDSAKEVLRLSKGEAPGDKTMGGDAQALQDKIQSLEEEAVARNKALEDSNNRIALLEKNIKEMQHLLELKGLPVPQAGEAAKAEAKSEAAVSAVAAAAPAASAVAAAKPAAQPKPVAKPKPKPAPKLAPPPPPPPPSLVDEIMGEPLYLGAGAAVLLALGGLGLIAVRRRQAAKASTTFSPVGETTGSHIAEPEVSSPENGDFTQQEDLAEDEQAEEVDPISEAELFLNFGRDAQAEEVLKEALNKDPNNLRVQLKLLEIYANRNDANAFSSIARRVKDSGDAEAWEQAAEMGRKIDPSNPMYGGSGEAVAEQAEPEAAVESEEAENETPSVLDFDLGFGVDEAATEQPAEEAVAEVEAQSEPVAELAAEEPENTEVLSTEELRAAQDAPMDFDVSGSFRMPEPEAEQAAPQQEEGGLDFDVTSTNPSMTPMSEEGAEAEEAAKSAENLDDLVFDVTATHPSTPAMGQEEEETVAENKPMDFDLGDISLNLDGIGEEKPAAEAPAAEGGKDERWHEVATKLDLAKAYQEMGDAEGAREILEEVKRDGDEQQREAAQGLLDQLSA